MRAVRFVAVGELLVDVVARGSGHEARIRVEPGGSAFNAASVAARLGAQATVLGTVGTDAAGEMILAALVAHRVDAAQVRRVEGRTGTFLLAGGETRVDRGVSRDVVLPGAVEGDVVLVSGYLSPETIEHALAGADAGWIALDAARLDGLPRGGNALFANEKTATRVAGTDLDGAVRLLGSSYRLACITRGRAGAIAVLDGRLATAAPPASHDLDAPGTGDAFAAALLVELARDTDLGRALAEACRWGAAAAAGA